VEVNVDEVEAALDRAKESLSVEDHELLKSLVESYAYLTELLDDKSTTIARLRALLGGSSSEKTKDVLGEDDDASANESPGDAADASDNGPQAEREAGPNGEKKRTGHGRNGAKDYPGAERVSVPHETLCSGDQCPACSKGKVYTLKMPGVIVRVTGQAPVHATVYELQKLRCNLCGEVFTASAPEGIGTEKYDARSASMIALLKYGSGLPFNRLGGLQRSLGVPLPPSTQWEIVHDVAKALDPVYGELIRQAAQGEVVHNDDTSMTILEFTGGRRLEHEDDSEPGAHRTGVFTSGIVSTAAGRRIALFFTGRRHAGENLANVLAQRAAELGPPIQMCDALSRNTSPAFETIVANCMAHGRRRFVDVVQSFPAECRHVLETLGEVYRNDATAREQNMSPEDRLRLHQATSGPVMDELHGWMMRQIEQRKVEPNSGLGHAIAYMLKHWKKLTQFLHVPGAPLDNNRCERALKKVILHRKNALFYKTANGARVGDFFMSLVYTCQLSGANAFEYLTALQEHLADVTRDPAAWMPWNYRDTLAAAANAASTG
jgi:transposase